MMNVFIDKLERLMGELKNEPVNQKKKKKKRQCLTLVKCNGHKASKKYFNLKEYNQNINHE